MDNQSIFEEYERLFAIEREKKQEDTKAHEIAALRERIAWERTKSILSSVSDNERNITLQHHTMRNVLCFLQQSAHNHNCTSDCRMQSFRKGSSYQHDRKTFVAQENVYVCWDYGVVHLCGEECNAYVRVPNGEGEVCSLTGKFLGNLYIQAAENFEFHSIIGDHGGRYAAKIFTGGGEKEMVIKEASSEAIIDNVSAAKMGLNSKLMKKIQKDSTKKEKKEDSSDLPSPDIQLAKKVPGGIHQKYSQYVLAKYPDESESSHVQRLKNIKKWLREAEIVYRMMVLSEDYYKLQKQKIAAASAQYFEEATKYIIRKNLDDGECANWDVLIDLFTKIVKPSFDGVFYISDIKKVNKGKKQLVIDAMVLLWDKLSSLSKIKNRSVKFMDCAHAILSIMGTRYNTHPHGLRIAISVKNGKPTVYNSEIDFKSEDSIQRHVDTCDEEMTITFIPKMSWLLLANNDVINRSKRSYRRCKGAKGSVRSIVGKPSEPIQGGKTVKRRGLKRKIVSERISDSKTKSPISPYTRSGFQLIPATGKLKELFADAITASQTIEELRSFRMESIINLK